MQPTKRDNYPSKSRIFLVLGLRLLDYINVVTLGMLSKLLCCSLLILGYFKVTAQNQLRFGYGSYEGINMSMVHGIFQDSELSVGVGAFDRFTKDRLYVSAFLEYNLPFPYIKSENWRVSTSLIFWRLEDQSYIWHMGSAVPALQYSYRSKMGEWRIGTGPAFNLVLNNQRKTYYDVGWPYQVGLNYSVSLTL